MNPRFVEWLKTHVVGLRVLFHKKSTVDGRIVFVSDKESLIRRCRSQGTSFVVVVEFPLNSGNYYAASTAGCWMYKKYKPELQTHTCNAFRDLMYIAEDGGRHPLETLLSRRVRTTPNTEPPALDEHLLPRKDQLLRDNLPDDVHPEQLGGMPDTALRRTQGSSNEGLTGEGEGDIGDSDVEAAAAAAAAATVGSVGADGTPTPKRAKTKSRPPLLHPGSAVAAAPPSVPSDAAMLLGTIPPPGSPSVSAHGGTPQPPTHHHHHHHHHPAHQHGHHHHAAHAALAHGAGAAPVWGAGPGAPPSPPPVTLLSGAAGAPHDGTGPPPDDSLPPADDGGAGSGGRPKRLRESLDAATLLRVLQAVRQHLAELTQLVDGLWEDVGGGALGSPSDRSV